MTDESLEIMKSISKSFEARWKQLGGKVVGIACLIELVELGGRAKLAGEDLFAVLQY